MRTSITALILLANTATTLAIDNVWVRSDTGETSTLTGEITRYDRDSLILSNGDRQRTLATSKIDFVESNWPTDHLAARRYREQADWHKAIQSYSRALRAEQRQWAQQLLLGEAAIAYREQGNLVRAADTVAALLQRFPTARCAYALPLAWTDRSPDRNVEKQASMWMVNTKQSAIQLLGASWLLAGAQRTKARAVLEKLADSGDPAMAQLAMAQLWRTELASVSAARLQQWPKIIETMPAAIRAGPTFVWAAALARREPTERAANAFLRIPILHPEHHNLSAAALVEAAAILDKLARPTEANRLYRELGARFGDTNFAAETKTRITQAQKSN